MLEKRWISRPQIAKKQQLEEGISSTWTRSASEPSLRSKARISTCANTLTTAADNYSLSSHARPHPLHLVMVNFCCIQDFLIGLAIGELLPTEATRSMSTSKKRRMIHSAQRRERMQMGLSPTESGESKTLSHLELIQPQRFPVKGMDWVSAIIFGIRVMRHVRLAALFASMAWR